MSKAILSNKVLTLKTDQNTDRVFSRIWQETSPFFLPTEIFSPDTIDNGLHLIDIKTLEKLNRFREYCGQSLCVNHRGLKMRGVRSPREQVKLQSETQNAAELSMHCCGKAFDLFCPGLSIDQLADAAKAFGWEGIGINRKQNFVHVDRRTLWGTGPVIWVY